MRVAGHLPGLRHAQVLRPVQPVGNDERTGPIAEQRPVADAGQRLLPQLEAHPVRRVERAGAGVRGAQAPGQRARRAAAGKPDEGAGEQHGQHRAKHDQGPCAPPANEQHDRADERHRDPEIGRPGHREDDRQKPARRPHGDHHARRHTVPPGEAGGEAPVPAGKQRQPETQQPEARQVDGIAGRAGHASRPGGRERPVGVGAERLSERHEPGDAHEHRREQCDGEKTRATAQQPARGKEEGQHGSREEHAGPAIVVAQPRDRGSRRGDGADDQPHHRQHGQRVDEVDAQRLAAVERQRPDDEQRRHQHVQRRQAAQVVRRIQTLVVAEDRHGEHQGDQKEAGHVGGAQGRPGAARGCRPPPRRARRRREASRANGHHVERAQGKTWPWAADSRVTRFM